MLQHDKPCVLIFMGSLFFSEQKQGRNGLTRGGRGEVGGGDGKRGGEKEMLREEREETAVRFKIK